MPRVLDGGAAGRRSTRLPIAIPLLLEGRDATGQAFKENTRTIVINKHGAKILTMHQLVLGAELDVENRAVNRSTKASVVWVGEQAPPNQLTEVAIQLLTSENFWGIDFPPEDWQEGVRQPLLGEEAPSGARAGVPSRHGPASLPPPNPAPAPSPTQVPPARLAGTAPPRPAGPAIVQAPMDIPKLNQLIDSAVTQLKSRCEEFLNSSLGEFELKVNRIANRVGVQFEGRSQEVLNNLREKLEETGNKHLAATEERAGKNKREMEYLLEAAQTAHELLESAHEKALQRTEELGAAIEFQVKNAEQAVPSLIEDQVKNAGKTLTDQLQISFVQKLESLVEERVGRVTEGLDEQAAAITGSLRKQLEEESKTVLESVKETLGGQAEIAEQRLKAALEKSASEWESALERVQAALSTTLNEHEQRIESVGESALEKWRQQARLIADETGQELEKSFPSLQSKALEEFEVKFQTRVEQVIESAAEQATRHAEDTLEMVTEELKQRSTRALEESAAALRAKFPEIFSAVGMAGQQLASKEKSPAPEGGPSPEPPKPHRQS